MFYKNKILNVQIIIVNTMSIANLDEHVSKCPSIHVLDFFMVDDL